MRYMHMLFCMYFVERKWKFMKLSGKLEGMFRMIILKGKYY